MSQKVMKCSKIIGSDCMCFKIQQNDEGSVA